MNTILFILNVALVLVCAACLLACARLRSKPAYLFGIYILSYADIVIVLEIAGLLSAIERWVVLALQLILTAAALLLWLRNAKPPLLGPFSGLKITRPGIAGILTQARKSPFLTSLVVLLTLGVIYTYARRAQLVLLVPPDNWDSLTYHLSRVGYWLQYKSLQAWPTPNPRQTSWPINAELGLLWTILWWGTDQLAGFVQWITVPVIMVGIYGLVRLLRYSRWQGAVIALLWGTLVQVMDQSSTTQNDLVTTSFWLGTLFFFLSGVRQQNSTHFYLSGIAFGLAMGTKSTSVMLVPGLGVAACVVIFHSRNQKKSQPGLIRWVIACILSFLVLGFYTYAQNSMVFRNPTGPLSIQKEFIGLPGNAPMTAYLERIRDNTARYVYQLVDFSPLPFGLPQTINPLKAALFSFMFDRLGVSIQNPDSIAEGSSFGLQYINGVQGDTAWFGPLSAFLMMAVVYQGYRAIRRGDALPLVLALTAMGFLVVDSAAEVWFPYTGRYYNIPVALAFPLMACLLESRGAWRTAVVSVLVLLSLITMYTATIKNDALERIGWKNAFDGSRFSPSWLSIFNYRMIAENVPLNASIGIDSDGNFRDYPFFGEHFTRRVTLAIPADESIMPRVDTRRFIADFQNSDFLYLPGGGSPLSQTLASNEFRLLSIHDGDSLWMRNDLRGSEACDGDKWPFTDFFQSSSAWVCPQFPIIPGTVADGFVQSSFLSTGKFVPVIGTGSHAQFEFGLLVKQQANVGFSIQVQSRDGKQPQTLMFAISSADSEPRSFSAGFREETSLDFLVPLQPGAYRIHLGLTNGEQASINRFQVMTP